MSVSVSGSFVRSFPGRSNFTRVRAPHSFDRSRTGFPAQNSVELYNFKDPRLALSIGREGGRGDEIRSIRLYGGEAAACQGWMDLGIVLLNFDSLMPTITTVTNFFVFSFIISYLDRFSFFFSFLEFLQLFRLPIRSRGLLS